MNRVVKQGIIFISLVAIVSIIRLPYGSYKNTFLPKLRSKLTSANIGVDFEDARVSFPFNQEISKLKLFFSIKNIPLQVYSESIKSETTLLSLLKLNPHITTNSLVYGGSIQVDMNYPLLSRIVDAKLSTKDFPLESFPLAQGFVVAGKLSLDIESSFDKNNLDLLALEDSKINLQIKDASYLGDDIYMSVFKFPKISNLQLLAKAILNKQKLNITSFELESSLGKSSATGVLHLARNYKIDYASFSISLEFSDEGQEKLAGYLALASSTDIAKAGKNWNIEIELTAGSKPTIKVTPR